LGISRSMLRYVPQPRYDETPLRQAIIRLAAQYGRYGYRQITGLLWQEGWDVSRSRVERIWKLEGLRVPPKQPKRGRLWLADGSCVRLRPERRNHVWSWDFVMDRTDDGRPIKILTLIDEYTKEALAIVPARRIRSNDVIDIFADVMIERGIPAHIRSDNGPEMVATKLREWLDQARHEDAVHRAGQSMGERLLRKLQRQAAQRVAERRDLLHATRSTGTDRAMATALQPSPTTQRAGLPPAGARGTRARPRASENCAASTGGVN
jgi:transposase InsO family protein